MTASCIKRVRLIAVCHLTGMARPIIDAIRSGDVALAKKLLQSQKYSYIDCQTSRRDGTALFWAACRGLIDIVDILLSHGACVNSQTGYGATPLHAAADANKIGVIRLLLQYGANIDSCTTNGDTPCHLAAYRGHNEAVQVLVELGANLNMRNRKFHLPIDEAESGGHYLIVDYLNAVSKMYSQFAKQGSSCTEIPGSPVKCNHQHQRVPLRDCNSSPVCLQESLVSPGRLYFNESPQCYSQTTSDVTLGTGISENKCDDHEVTFNDLSMDTNSIPNSELNLLNIPC